MRMAATPATKDRRHSNGCSAPWVACSSWDCSHSSGTKPRPPRTRVRSSPLASSVSSASKNQFVAHVRVTNDGGETAQGVSVVGEVRAEGGTVQRATTTLAYVPAESGGNAALIFGVDPRKGDLVVRAAGYELP
jgi:uncharacterized protein (TIGR02588 family)